MKIEIEFNIVMYWFGTWGQQIIFVSRNLIKDRNGFKVLFLEVFKPLPIPKIWRPNIWILIFLYNLFFGFITLLSCFNLFLFFYYLHFSYCCPHLCHIADVSAVACSGFLQLEFRTEFFCLQYFLLSCNIK